MIHTGKQQETLQSVFTSLGTKESNHKTTGDRKMDFIPCDAVEEELILVSFKNTDSEAAPLL